MRLICNVAEIAKSQGSLVDRLFIVPVYGIRPQYQSTDSDGDACSHPNAGSVTYSDSHSSFRSNTDANTYSDASIIYGVPPTITMSAGGPARNPDVRRLQEGRSATGAER